MGKFNVVYVKGRVIAQDSTVRFDAASGRLMLEMSAVHRPEAYIQAYRHFTKLGFEVFVVVDADRNGKALGFSDSELKIVEDEGTPIDTDLKDGIRIDRIIPAS